MFDCVLNAAEGVIIYEIACGTHDKQIANSLIENDFGRRAGIRATDNNCEWMLSLRRCRALLCGWFARTDFVLAEALVSLNQFRQRSVRWNRLVSRRGSQEIKRSD